MLKIPGYEEGPLVQGSAHLNDPLFWPVHLGTCLRGEDARRAAFGADWDAATDLLHLLHDERAWPVFDVPLRSGHTFHVVYRNIERERGVDYLLHHPTWPAAETLAVDDGHFMGPGLAWPELLSVARRPTAEGPADTDARLLLLFPTLGDALIPDDAAATLTSALAALTVILVEAPHGTTPQPHGRLRGREQHARPPVRVYRPVRSVRCGARRPCLTASSRTPGSRRRRPSDASRQQPRVTDSATAYRSSACRISTHYECAHSTPTAAPADIPVVYEACDCSCHPASDRSTPKEVPQ